MDHKRKIKAEGSFQQVITLQSLPFFFTHAMTVSMETGANQWLRECILLVPVSTETCILDCQKCSYCCPAKFTKPCCLGITSFLPVLCSGSQSQSILKWQSSYDGWLLHRYSVLIPCSFAGHSHSVDYQTQDTIHCNLENISCVMRLELNAARNKQRFLCNQILPYYCSLVPSLLGCESRCNCRVCTHNIRALLGRQPI